MSVRTIKGNRLFWKITAVFTGLLIVLGVLVFLGYYLRLTGVTLHNVLH